MKNYTSIILIALLLGSYNTIYTINEIYNTASN